MKSLAPSAVTHSDPKGRKLVSIVEAAYDKAGLTEDEAQRVNNTPGLGDLIAKFIEENRYTDLFKDEEVRTDYTYPEEYAGPKPIEDQIKAIAAVFGLDPTQALEFAKTLPPLPQGAEGWFAIPRWDKVATTYGEAVEQVLVKLKEQRGKLYNYREGQLGPEYLRQSARTQEHMAKIMEAQPGDILIVAAQFGKRHRGRSVRRALEIIKENTGEFGLGAFANGCMTLAHPERFVRWEQLHLDCSGDEFAPGADGDFSRAPFFYWLDGGLGFSAYFVDSASGQYGTSSAFLPQPAEQ